jgi:predicted ATP-dependent endonuclease of OLD family
MKLRKFRIYNYKSIKDSDYCWLASDLTVLAGKNEAGKSAILEALKDFALESPQISKEAYPLDNSGKPEIEVVFKLDKKEIDQLLENNFESNKFSESLMEEISSFLQQNDITIIMNAEGDYSFGEDNKSYFQAYIHEYNLLVSKLLKDELRQYKDLNINPNEFTVIENISLEDIKSNLPKVTESIRNKINEIPLELQKDALTILENIDAIILQFKNDNDIENLLEEILNKYLPHFILFSDFRDILPFEIPIVEATKNETVTNFAKIAKINLETISQPDTTKHDRRNLLSTGSATISVDFDAYWGQDKVKLTVEPDGDILRFGVTEENDHLLFKPEQRSRGFQWFLSFYLRLNAEKEHSNIVLIDEPGLYLHAKAQKDVLKVLETLSNEMPIIFSTHSPYLIDPERLDRVRLVENNNTGTTIENKFYKLKDTETLTPILTAIGLDLSRSFSVIGKKNALLEGISDYYYLNALNLYNNPSKLDTICLIPCVGANKIPIMASLLMGWDLDFVAIYDTDKEGKKVARELSKRGIDARKIIPLHSRDEVSIEDLFTHKDFNKFVSSDLPNESEEIPNSKFVKSKLIDKVLLSKTLLDRIKTDKSSITFSKETIENFNNVFDKIQNGLSKL